jgi:hypothetical protein
MSEDPNREIRTMVLLTLPYPPLPVAATRLEMDDARLQDEEVITSHSFIAKGIDEAMIRNRPEENRERKARQIDIFQRFLHAMATEGFFCNPERLYYIYCQFTLEHIASYFPPGHPIDIRFQPLSSIAKGDKCHGKMAEYMASQSVYYEDNPQVRRYQYVMQEFHEMLAIARGRLGHALTDEERLRLAQQVDSEA